ncbi:cytochrome C biosynthesis protein [Flavobacterium columnare NBRC 100251 = ATCC 23463]|uniref:tetratricopeptide repeat protein n=1 Tax=Flavobacterium columnare TaxID=996 RepID=UPI0009814CFA|nr:tetratricopeptide repeat protein [Flavobacterium columnare]OOB82292.1 cytochrome C biosynthesis protein [Flavobacterium columnare]PDS23337.1 cytochrome C biosynthesis protein [Flavobacterium columnare NBRC 100251 = ATCC 23463]PTD15720.1 tetratricopeptide repeat protein [Flavobacterium columnare]QOG89725.1 tetratricopeptide repeat protein [Flavobacterium columnare]QOG92381.1 tetratricopeptide repeat protein [Flavobacterium columnare]
MNKTIYKLACFIFITSTHPFLAQTDPENIVSDDDSFQEAYYESLKQKGIENYDKALIELEKCLQLQPNNAVIYHELGKNYYFKKDYISAEEAYIKATELDSKNKWNWIDLYDVYYNTKNYNQGISVLQKIIVLDKKYKEDLLALYMYTRQFDKALILINELDESEGKTERRNQYRAEINRQTNISAGSKSDLEKAIETNPLNEENYLSLITKYSETNQEEKARQVIEKLKQNLPTSEWAAVFLFKYHITDTKGTEAFNTLETVLKSRKIDKKIKIKMFNEFLIFVSKNPIFENQLSKAMSYFEGDPEFNVHKEVGKFYFKKKQWDLAIKNFEKSIILQKNDLETALCTLICYEEKKDYQVMLKLTTDYLDLYPNQPEFYYFAGKANFELKNYKKANEFLEIGFDYIIENPVLEINFLNLISDVSIALGNTKKAEEYQKKALIIKNTKK